MSAGQLNRFLGSDDALSRLRDHAARLVRMQGQLERQLPPNMLGAVSVANFETGILTLHVSTPALASRLKMSQESLRAALSAAGEPIQGIRIKVRAVHSSERGGLYARETRSISPQSKAALKNLGESLDPGSALARALREMVNKTR
ncbi:MAG: DciA family protein [Rhodocyclaceae bacterium]